VIVCQERFLVIRRSRWVVAPGKFCFPGGGIEGSESEGAALVREIREELNVAIVPGGRIWESVTPWQTHLAWWSAQLPDDVEPVPTLAEVESIHWWTRDEMLQEAELLESNRRFLEALAAGNVAWKV
jgi:8-oxo-dGTP pyrophosphatase MutT (NUDIX family)